MTLLVVVLVAWASAGAPACQYRLSRIGDDSLPWWRPALRPGEGSRLHSIGLTFEARTFRAVAIVEHVDSASVTDTVLAAGTWRRDGDSLRVEYEWSYLRFRRGAVERDAGQLAGNHIAFSHFAWFGPAFFRGPRPLIFEPEGACPGWPRS